MVYPGRGLLIFQEMTTHHPRVQRRYVMTLWNRLSETSLVSAAVKQEMCQRWYIDDVLSFNKSYLLFWVVPGSWKLYVPRFVCCPVRKFAARLRCHCHINISRIIVLAHLHPPSFSKALMHTSDEWFPACSYPGSSWSITIWSNKPIHDPTSHVSAPRASWHFV